MALDAIVSIFNNTLFFIFFIVLVFAFLGWLTGSFSMGIFAGFLVFIHVTIQQDIVLLTNLLYISMIAILFFAAFRTYGMAFSSGGEEM